jgi:hypothetical protein
VKARRIPLFDGISGRLYHLLQQISDTAVGTITKRGELQWQAKVRRKGSPAQSRTFMYREDAGKRVRAVEYELRAGCAGRCEEALRW